MQKSLPKILMLIWLLAFLLSCGSRQEKEPVDQIQAESQTEITAEMNILTDEEKAEGWILLFDGKSFEGWQGLGREGIPEEHWIIENGMIKKVPSKDVPLQEDGQPLVGGDLMTIQMFDNFELSLEWKIASGGNSGIKYNVSEEMSTTHPPKYAALGFEYQILDDDRNLDALVSKTHTAAALYDLIAPVDKNLNPPGEFNTARIVLNGNHGEHWLNGIKVLEYELLRQR